VLQLLDRHLVSSECGGAQALGSLDSQLAETEDVLSYVSDLLSLGELAAAFCGAQLPCSYSWHMHHSAQLNMLWRVMVSTCPLAGRLLC
jgi:hypothetical protein